jgi:hypothetical protein
MHPPEGGLSKVPVPFFLGILLAALGGFLVTYFKPAVPPKHRPVVAAPANPAR